MLFGDILRGLREDRDLKQEDIAKYMNVDRSTVGKWESSSSKPDFEKLIRLSEFYGVSTDHLLGLNTIKDNKEIKENIIQKFIRDESGTLNIGGLVGTLISSLTKSVRINVYGSIPAGIPLEAIQDIQDWEDIPVAWLKGGKEYIALKVKGDSMYPKYLEGDTVIIQLQPDCETGQDCVCYVNGYDATLKKVIKTNNSITLSPINPNYAPQTYKHPGEVKIVGIVKEIRRKV